MASRSLIMTFPFALGVPGGGTRDCIETARHLRRAGARVTLIPVLTHIHTRFPRPDMPQEQRGDTQEASLRADGVEVAAVERNKLHYLLDAWSVARKVEELLRREPVDAVLSYWQEGLSLPEIAHRRKVTFAMIASAPSYRMWFGGRHLQRLSSSRSGARNRLKYVAKRFVYGPVADRLRYWKGKVVVGASLRRADLVFARSRFTAREVVDLFGVDQSRVRVSYCGVDDVFFRTPHPAFDRVEHLLYFGALIPEKGIFDAIGALGRLASKGLRHWTLRVAGWGDHEAVRRAAVQNRIDDRTELLGPLDRSALLEHLAWAHLAVLPSRAESFGLAIGESQAAGLPVVACEAGAVPEVVQNGSTAWLVPPGDIDALGRAIEAAIADPSKAFAMGSAGRERIARLFSWERTAAGILESIDECREEIAR